MKLADFILEKIRNLINGHLILEGKPSTIFTNKRKRNEGEDDQQIGDQIDNIVSSQPKKPKITYDHCHKSDHEEKDCWIKDSSKRFQRGKGKGKAHPKTTVNAAKTEDVEMIRAFKYRIHVKIIK